MNYKPGDLVYSEAYKRVFKVIEHDDKWLEVESLVTGQNTLLHPKRVWIATKEQIADSLAERIGR